jgi:hypothetical protein
MSWLLEAASPPIQYRAYSEIAPVQDRDPVRLAALRAAVLQFKPAAALARKQKASGLWGGNLLGPQASKVYGWKEPGTIYQYLRLLEYGWPADHRVIKATDRFLFQLLSRLEPDDPDPALASRARELLLEYEKPAKTDLGLARWARQLGREAAAAALARAGHSEDPRLRGIALKIASDVSLYMRSEVAQKPFRRAKGKTVLDPAAYPPSIFVVEMLAFLPALQRERSGFIERLATYVAAPAPKRAWLIAAGNKLLKPLFPIVGDPLGADARGAVRDVPFALYWIELLARLGIVRQVPSAARTLARFFADCDERGVWAPKNLRAAPKALNPLAAHYFPLEGAGRSPAQRQTDVTFRLALIAKIAGLPVEIA